MANKLSLSELDGLKEAFTSHPGTQAKWYEVKSRWCRFIHGVEKEEELWEREFINGDLVMMIREAVGDILTTILDLSIIDTRGGLISSWRDVTELDDLLFRLKIMDDQRRTESKRRSEAA